MHHSPVVSAPVTVDLSGGTNTHKVIKLITGGVALCTSSDKPAGTLMRENQVPALSQSAVGFPCDIALPTFPVHYVQLGATSAAINPGDPLCLDPNNSGCVVPTFGSLSNATVIMRAFDTIAAAALNAVINAYFSN